MRGPTLARAGLCAALLIAASCMGLTAPVVTPTESASEGQVGVLPSTLPVRRDAAPRPEFGWTALIGLGAVVLAVVGWWTWAPRMKGRRFGGASANPATIVRLSSQALTPQASVHAVAWNGEEYLIACTPQQVVLVSRKGLPPSAGEGK